MKSLSYELVRAEIKEIKFGIYSEDELRSLSVCRVSATPALDNDGNAVKDGLYDPRMGPVNQQSPRCETCDLWYANCPGHFGHIELDVPLYHPMHFPSLYKLMQSKCVLCHKLRVIDQRAKQLLLVLKLHEMGDVDTAAKIMATFGKSLTVGGGKSTELSVMDDVDYFNEADEKDSVIHMKRIEAKYEIFRRKGTLISGRTKQLQRDLINDLLKMCTRSQKCANCGGISPKLRKDGFTKIYQKASSAKDEKEMLAKKMKLKSALQQLDEDPDERDIGSDSDSDSDSSGTDADEAQAINANSEAGAVPAASKADVYLAPLEVEAQMRLLWTKEEKLLDFIWSRAIDPGHQSSEKTGDSWRLFFVRTVPVPPNRFRPSARMGSSNIEHPQNKVLTTLLEAHSQLRIARGMEAPSSEAKSERGRGRARTKVSVEIELDEETGMDLKATMTTWMDLQNAFIAFVDSDKDKTQKIGSSVAGIRQLLERKEGLFRRHMMGKRVNFCCRSVISPDPYLGTNEIGIPVKFASTLHIPTPVTPWNVTFLRNLVERGPNQYPGANSIETPDGKIINLSRLTVPQREARGKLLLSVPGTRVHRHLLTGDPLLVNRQPTLHKPGIMAHRARVLQHVPEQTIRMNYPNCNAYNADFDGDEMNCHFVQNQIARAEANYLCNTDNQYIVPTSGNPLRGLIQDHVASAVKLTVRNTFLKRSDFQQLLYVAVSGLEGTEMVLHTEDMIMPAPAIVKPYELWTGKQVISALMHHMCRPPLPLLHLDGKARTPATALGATQSEHLIVFRHGELLSGVLDKAAIGNATLGIVHAVYELYGADMAGRLLSAFGRLFTCHLQDAGQSCGLQDLVLTPSADEERIRLLQKVRIHADRGLLGFLTGDSALADGELEVTAADKIQCEELVANSGSMLSRDLKVKLDGAMQGVINKAASDVIKVCLPAGLQMPFLSNHFSMMVLTGAKGSAVNQSQISCFLGQQALEGQRVPVMVSGKTLPSFRAFDASARAGGFVQDRFLTGVKPQEYYFHCMAGREGLVDTAVKTSRSGYLQRCLVKCLEELKVNYDMTVRDSGGNIVQFLYGEDGLDPMSSNMLEGSSDKMLFLARNYLSLVHKYSINESFISQGFDLDQAEKHRDLVNRAAGLVKNPKRSFQVGDVILAKRRKSADTSWTRNNLRPQWYTAEIMKVRSEDNGRSIMYDIKYSDDDTIEKRVLDSVDVVGQPSVGGVGVGVTAHDLRTELLKPGLPDPAMSCLPLGSSIGACSEKVQLAVDEYMTKNPDGILSRDPSSTTVAKNAFEFLVWVKYMRSMACPGEPVGCVAAQSIGEPSTQMTLNTFHLAGHGGANVTLGIPRLREIIMTASQKAKTPTMLIPLKKGTSMMDGKVLATRLSRLSLADLLSHREGVRVTETFCKSGAEWMRKYAVRIHFESVSRIKEFFGVTFDEIVERVSGDFMKRINFLVKKQSKLKPIDVEDLKVSVAAKTGGRVKLADDDGDEVDEGGDDEGKEGEALDVLFDGDGDEGGGDSDDDKGEQDGAGYEDDDIEDGDEGGGGRLAVDVKRSGATGTEIESGSDSDSDDSEPLDKSKQSKSTSGGGLDNAAKSKGDTLSNAKSSRVATKSSSDITHSEKEGWAELTIILPASSRRLLLVQIVEAATQYVSIRSTKGIKNAYSIQSEVDGEDRIAVQTEGVNFAAAWDLGDAVDHREISSNDIFTILQTFGVEAARRSIVGEIVSVFGVYGINVNQRHLSLIADFMTREGAYTPMNRRGMGLCESPFLQMSFETTCAFLSQAAHSGASDTMESPSARIVVGKVAKLGTGVFDVLVPIHKS